MMTLRRLQTLEAENARLREELRLSQECEAIIQRKLAAAQLDAARYRWLKNTSQRNAAGFHPIGYCAKPGEDIDAAVDAAIKEQS